MTPVTYQTIKLSRGRHTSPERGACVMELASMLAGESFSDHPASVCPVIGSFLRAYNDRVDNQRRQDLYAYASKVVGSRASWSVAQARTDRLNHWIGEIEQPRHWTRFLLAGVRQMLTNAPHPDDVGSRAVHAISSRSERTHKKVLALIDELLAISDSGRVTPLALEHLDGPHTGRTYDPTNRL